MLETDIAAAVDATVARIKALQDAEAALEERRRLIRRMHYDYGMPKGEVARVLWTALHDRGVTAQQLQDAGVSHSSVMKVLRKKPTNGPADDNAKNAAQSGED